jgi:enamine deaminase RidA (YjgF/YER057c/UK114 family)
VGSPTLASCSRPVPEPGSRASPDDVVKALFFMTDASKYREVSDVRNIYFSVARPASAMVEISNTVAEGCDVEIEVMAIIDTP